MRFPEFLQENGTIGFVAPSFGCSFDPYKAAFMRAQAKFKSMGYKLELGPNCYEGLGIGISNTPHLCGSELMEYYMSESNDILISCGGGELMCETIEHVDFEKLAQCKPKWYMGYSDNTNMTFLLTTLCDTASVYGPCAAAFGMEPWHKSLYDAFDILTGKNLTVSGYDMWEKESLKSAENPYAPYNVTEKREIRRFVNGDMYMHGRLLGGCMDCLVNLLGTRFDKVLQFAEKYKEDGIIWFLESCDLNVMSIRRAVWQMKNAGWFKYVKGFIIGRPYCHGQEMMGLNQYRAVYDVIKEFNVPVVMDVDIGHLAPMMPLVCGSLADVEVKGNDIRINMNMR